MGQPLATIADTGREGGRGFRSRPANMIRARDLRKAYAKIQAVNGVSLELVAGETFGLLGPNGAGKSTTFHMLTGALRPDGGEVTINGSADPTRAEVRRQIGVAP